MWQKKKKFICVFIPNWGEQKEVLMITLHVILGKDYTPNVCHQLICFCGFKFFRSTEKFQISSTLHKAKK